MTSFSVSKYDFAQMRFEVAYGSSIHQFEMLLRVLPGTLDAICVYRFTIASHCIAQDDFKRVLVFNDPVRISGIC